MPNNTEAQRRRRLARRRCGGCGGPAAFMRYWRGALVPVCAGCAEKLAVEGTESNASNQADLEAQIPPDHGSCITLQQLAPDLKDSVRPVAAMRAQVRMYRTAATRKRDRANREQVRKMMESFEAAHMEERALLQEELEREWTRRVEAELRIGMLERSATARENPYLGQVGLQPPCDSRPGLTVLAGPLFHAPGHDHCP